MASKGDMLLPEQLAACAPGMRQGVQAQLQQGFDEVPAKLQDSSKFPATFCHSDKTTLNMFLIRRREGHKCYNIWYQSQTMGADQREMERQIKSLQDQLHELTLEMTRRKGKERTPPSDSDSLVQLYVKNYRFALRNIECGEAVSFDFRSYYKTDPDFITELYHQL
ncbi:hypothetical protein E3N88_28709 [Mikania micrantha]|uniref:Uncharacterized protein n=1 Tax=Mikania micrantha TaxID=192012 RepID=A0A5N6N0J6_9ASTR|nr:hypothetical protein E3N88_28709 [Mikania micrantha]